MFASMFEVYHFHDKAWILFFDNYCSDQFLKEICTTELVDLMNTSCPRTVYVTGI
jgi:hypothetical protein